MTLLYQDISNLIPFDIDTLIDTSKIRILNSAPCEDQFVHKEIYGTDIVNEEFLLFLKNKNIKVDKIIIWHWFCKNPEWAHIDCSPSGEILPCAINWTINSNKSQVNFYNIKDIDKTVRFGNEIDTGWRTDNVTAYIPINVKNIIPDAIWNNRGPALINTSVPHLIIASEMRTSVSLGLSFPVPTIEETLKRLML